MRWDYRGYGYLEDHRDSYKPFAQVVHLLCDLYLVSTEGSYRAYDTLEEARAWAEREAKKQNG